jgi:hypothetical protein
MVSGGEKRVKGDRRYQIVIVEGVGRQKAVDPRTGGEGDLSKLVVG